MGFHLTLAEVAALLNAALVLGRLISSYYSDTVRITDLCSSNDVSVTDVFRHGRSVEETSQCRNVVREYSSW